MKREVMGKMTRPWILGVALLLSAQLIQGTYSYFRTDIKNEDMLTVGTLQISILQGVNTSESTSKDFILGENLVPGTIITKTSYVRNYGNRPAYIRVRVESKWSCVKLLRDNEDWIEEPLEDGSVMLYYRHPVEPEEDTSYFVDHILLDSVEMNNDYAGRSSTIAYYAEGVQKNVGVEAIASAWGKKATLSDTGDIIKLEAQ